MTTPRKAPRPPRRPPAIADGWDWLRLSALPPDAPPEQIREMRRAFYAGVRWIMTVIVDEIANRPDREGELLLTDLELELSRFGRDVERGKA